MPNKPINERDEKSKDPKVPRDEPDDLDVRSEDADKVKAGARITGDACDGGE